MYSQNYKFEAEFQEVVHLTVISRYLKNVKSIYEFGAGSGNVIARLMKNLNKNFQFYASDWSEVAVNILKKIKIKKNEIKTFLFNFFSPNQNIIIEKKSLIITNGALEQTGTKYKNSVAFFDSFPDDGNLGVPMADSNNKIFIKNQQQLNFVNYESYNLEDLNYKGDYDKNTIYNKGDFVRLDPSLNYDFNEKSISNYSDSTSKFFVCVADLIKGQNPLYNTNVWKEDKCSKNLNGCLLRFGNSNVNIPFGGFPGTVGYDYRLPG